MFYENVDVFKLKFKRIGLSYLTQRIENNRSVIIGYESTVILKLININPSWHHHLKFVNKSSNKYQIQYKI